MKYQKRKRNSPIAKLIRNYLNKKSGKVSESRDEIKWRFDYLDWKDQKKILIAFLDSCMSDREWAYSKLLDNWDKTFEPKVKELWENYHEYKCSWSVIRYFPLEYIREHIDSFTDSRDYYFISLRFAMDKNYAIDRTKLSNTDYLALLYHSGRNISDDDARDTLFSIVHDCCLEHSFIPKLEHVGEGRYNDVVSPANYRKVRLGIYYLLKLDKDNVVQEFDKWNEIVEEAIYNSQEFKNIDKNKIDSEYEYNHKRTEIANLYGFQALDDRYKQPSDPTAEQMRQTMELSLNWSEFE